MSHEQSKNRGSSEKELIEPLLNLELQQSNDTKEPLSFASESILSTY